MDGARFDALTRILAAPSRRGLLRFLAGSVLVSAGPGLRATEAAADCNEGGTPCTTDNQCCSQRCVDNECLLDPGQQCQTGLQCASGRCEVAGTRTVKKKRKKGKKPKRKTIRIRECFCEDGSPPCAGICCDPDQEECAFPPGQTPTCLSIDDREPGEFCTADAQCASEDCADNACRCEGGSEPCGAIGDCCVGQESCQEVPGGRQCRCPDGRAPCGAQRICCSGSTSCNGNFCTLAQG